VTTWAVTMTLKGSPSEAILVELDEQLPWDGIVAAIPRLGQFTVTAMVEAPDWEKASSAVVDDMLEMVRPYADGDPVGIETVDLREYDRRADEPTIPEIVSSPEVAEILGVSRQRVHQLLAENPRFPQPILRLGSGPLWIADAIHRFKKEWNRKPGRPSSRARTAA
jgi:predicted DNA-binding transcriptional regulator AlpA